MTAKSPRRRPAPVVTRNDLLVLLNDDFARQCRSIYAHAVYAERFRRSDPKAAAAIESQGKLEVLAALALCQLIYDYDGTVSPPGDELNFILNADRVAAQGWCAETNSRLRQRIAQLRAAGEPGLAKRLRRILNAKKNKPPLGNLVPAARPKFQG
jgi:hypothetical protein